MAPLLQFDVSVLLKYDPVISCPIHKSPAEAALPLFGVYLINHGTRMVLILFLNNSTLLTKEVKYTLINQFTEKKKRHIIKEQEKHMETETAY